jgi:hypothetical protein
MVNFDFGSFLWRISLGLVSIFYCPTWITSSCCKYSCHSINSVYHVMHHINMSLWQTPSNGTPPCTQSGRFAVWSPLQKCHPLKLHNNLRCTGASKRHHSAVGEMIRSCFGYRSLDLYAEWNYMQG